MTPTVLAWILSFTSPVGAVTTVYSFPDEATCLSYAALHAASTHRNYKGWTFSCSSAVVWHPPVAPKAAK